MARPTVITPELRETILQRHAIGVPAARLARQYGIGKTTVFRVLAKARAQKGTVANSRW